MLSFKWQIQQNNEGINKYNCKWGGWGGECKELHLRNNNNNNNNNNEALCQFLKKII
jgi:hypothetical protein